MAQALAAALDTPREPFVFSQIPPAVAERLEYTALFSYEAIEYYIAYVAGNYEADKPSIDVHVVFTGEYFADLQSRFPRVCPDDIKKICDSNVLRDITNLCNEARDKYRAKHAPLDPRELSAHTNTAVKYIADSLRYAMVGTQSTRALERLRTRLNALCN